MSFRWQWPTLSPDQAAGHLSQCTGALIILAICAAHRACLQLPRAALPTPGHNRDQFSNQTLIQHNFRNNQTRSWQGQAQEICNFGSTWTWDTFPTLVFCVGWKMWTMGLQSPPFSILEFQMHLIDGMSVMLNQGIYIKCLYLLKNKWVPINVKLNLNNLCSLNARNRKSYLVG